MSSTWWVPQLRATLHARGGALRAGGGAAHTLQPRGPRPACSAVPREACVPAKPCAAAPLPHTAPGPRPSSSLRLHPNLLPCNGLCLQVKAIVATQRDYGRRDDRRQARLKYLVHEWGVDKFR